MTEAIVIVAHPDDETIWMGGTILKNKDWSWTILSLCRKEDLDRMPKFLKVCKIYNATPIISDVDDDSSEKIPLTDLIKKIDSLVKKKRYDYIFTHGENGEYGHIRHIETHNAVKQMVKEGILITQNLFFFNYSKGENVPYPKLLPPSPIKESEIYNILTAKELNLKREIIKEIYGYPNEKGFELMSCNKFEAFKK
jgi:hypothetical protein